MGAESTGPVAGLLVCRRNTSAPPARQAPMTHGAQFVSPSRRSGWETAWSASGGGGILAGAAGVAKWLLGHPKLLEKSFFLLYLSGGSAGTPGCHFLWILNFLRNPFHWRTLYRLLYHLLILLLRPNWQCFKVVSAAVSGAKYMP